MRNNLKVIEDNLRCKICKIEFTNVATLNKHLQEDHLITPEEYVYRFLVDFDRKCKCGCGTEVKVQYVKGTLYWSDYTKNHFPRKATSEETKEKIRRSYKETCLQRYGVDNIRKSKYGKDRMKEVFLERYGVDNPMKVESIRQKNFHQVGLEVREKIRQTNLKKYGAVSFTSTEEGKKKVKQTNLERYGYENPSQSPIKKAERRKRNEERYGKGITTNLLLPEHRDKFQKVSEQEKSLQEFLLNQGICFETGKRKYLKNNLELDIYIPELKTGIEYNGMYFHSESCGKDSKYHLFKTESAAKEGIRLIHVWEAEWKFKTEIVKSNLLQLLGKTSRVIYARKTEVKYVEKKVAKQFLEENHLQGSSSDKVRLGLFLGTELVSLMTFSSLRRAVSMKGKEGSYELVRFCSKLNTRVVGGASKLFKHFIEDYSPEYILSYANRDWSVGGVYKNLGMEFKGYTTPGYCYSKNGRRFSRINFQKHKLVQQGKDSNLTESEIMKQDGFSRIWDCGNLKFEWKKLC